MKAYVPVATLLPKEIRDALVEASQIDPKKPAGMSLARTVKVEEAARRASRSYPMFFKKGA